MNTDFEILKEIKQVEVQPFLFTKIQQRIENRTQNFVSPKFALTFVSVILVMFAFDFIVIKNYKSENKSNITESMSLMPQNQLY